MKKIIISLALAISVFSVSSFAALNSYLQIKGSKGSSQVVSCPSGACVIPSLVADTYTVSVVDAQGKPVAPTDAISCEVKSPRDSGSGMATGRRMYKPLIITKELNSSSVSVDQVETNLSISCSSGTTPLANAESTQLKTTYDVKAAKK